MTRNRWWTLIAVLALAPLAVRSRAGAPECPKEKCSSSCPHQSSHKLIQKSYPVAGLVQTVGEGPAGSGGTDLLIRAITCAVKPETWSKHGGRGTIEYCPEGKELIVNQTAGVHERVEAVLKALAAIQPKQPAGTSPITRAVSNSPAAHLKHYGHFVLENVKVNAMGVSCTIKRIRFMYKGDGIDADVAKSVLPLQTSPPDQSTGSLEGAGPGAVAGNLIGKAIGGSCPSVGLPPNDLPTKSASPADPRTSPAVDATAGLPQVMHSKAEVKKSDETNKTEKGKAKPE